MIVHPLVIKHGDYHNIYVMFYHHKTFMYEQFLQISQPCRHAPTIALNFDNFDGALVRPQQFSPQAFDLSGIGHPGKEIGLRRLRRIANLQLAAGPLLGHKGRIGFHEHKMQTGLQCKAT